LRVIGTAGHVDHGKSTLIHALTGIHPDRLKEEQEREMTIELGFAWWHLPNGEEVGVVDVPGHRDFIGNMLAGVGGIDAALFVVAADEGVMPQTREHLAILDLLDINSGVVALTKIDKIEDESWLELVEEEFREVLHGTSLESAEIIRVSAKENKGLKKIQAALENVLKNTSSRPDLGRPRLSIDRVFTMSGFGTVVTGTLLDGQLNVGDEIEILPGGLKGRVRGLQTHKRKEERALPGSRTAVNISGINVDQIQRGQVVTLPGTLEETRRIDVHFKHIADSSKAVHHNDQVKLFVGAAEDIARLRLLEVKELIPGEEGWLQLELQEPVAVRRGDRYILRRPSPGETLGGGIVLDAHPLGRHKRFAKNVIERMQALTAGSPEELLLQNLSQFGVIDFTGLIERAGLDLESAQAGLDQLLDSEQVLVIEGKRTDEDGKFSLVSSEYWNSLVELTVSEVRKYHQTNPLRVGMSREELKSRVDLKSSSFNALIGYMIKASLITKQGPLVLLNDHKVEFNPEQKKLVDLLLEKFSNDPYSPPKIKECIKLVGEDVYLALIDMDLLMPISSDVVFGKDGYDQAVKEIEKYVKKNGSITLAQARDHLKTSRRYVQSLLEYMDAQGLTHRDGDSRKF